MVDRTWKILMAVGLTLGICAIVTALVSDSHLCFNSGPSNPVVDIHIGSEDGMTVSVLGAVSIVALIFGSAFFAQTRQNNTQNCAHSTGISTPFSFMTFIQNLHRSAKDCHLGGVCGGLGQYSPIPSWVWRMLFVIFFLCFGAGVLAYLILWICIPKASKSNAYQTLHTNASPGGSL
ncbi:MAG: hypothetical protein RLZZ408_1793 [Verrucomicrobiota bacterium]|jgi:phage shock protein PspC (stress-responsive transcriptional regulator)